MASPLDPAPVCRGPRAAVAVASGQGLAAWVMAGILLVGVASGSASAPVAALVTALFAAAVGSGLWFCARGLVTGRRWARSPVLTWQLFMTPVALTLLGGDRPWLGGALLASIVIGLPSVALPPRQAALR